VVVAAENSTKGFSRVISSSGGEMRGKHFHLRQPRIIKLPVDIHICGVANEGIDGAFSRFANQT